MHFSFFQSYFHFFRFDPKIRSDMTRRKNQEKKTLLTAFSRIFLDDQNCRSQYEEWMSGQINGSKTYFERVCLLCFENSTCVFGRPVVFYELRIQPFCYFWMSRTVAAVPTEAMRRWKTTFQLLWPIFFLSLHLSIMRLQHWKINRV